MALPINDYRARGKYDTELQKIKGLVDKLKISYPILVDSTTKARAAYWADVLPATVLIDKAGNILDYQIGIDGAEKIMAYVNSRNRRYGFEDLSIENCAGVYNLYLELQTH